VNATSAFPAENAVASTPLPPVPLWDAVVRSGHWLMAASFAGAWITAESERWRLLHVGFGYALAALVVFRVAWGFVGSRPARFASFLRGPRAVVEHVSGLLRGHHERSTGHNPLGGWAVLVLLGTSAALTVSGWLLYNDIVGHTGEEVHEALANGLMALVVVHVLAIVAMSLVERSNLVAAMISGRKRVPAAAAISPGRGRFAAVLLLAVVAGVASLPWIDRAGTDVVTAAHADRD
jgi:cytochrome b